MSDRRRAWVMPEYCSAQFYTGWHLYLMPDQRGPSDGPKPKDRDWIWLSGKLQLGDLRRALNHPNAPHLDTGVSEFVSSSYPFRVWFAETYPDGIEVVVEGHNRILGLAS